MKKRNILLIFCLYITTDVFSQCEETKKKKRWEFEIVEIEVALAVSQTFEKSLILNQNFLFRYEDKFRVNSFVDYNALHKYADYTVSYDQRIVKKIYLSATVENDFFGEEHKKDHFKLGVKTYLQDYEIKFLKDNFSNFSLDFGYSLFGTAEHRIHKPEFSYQILTKPIRVNKNEDLGLVLFSLGRIRTTTNVFIGQVGLESEKWHSVFMAGIGHSNNEFDIYLGFQYTLGHLRLLRCK